LTLAAVKVSTAGAACPGLMLALDATTLKPMRLIDPVPSGNRA